MKNIQAFATKVFITASLLFGLMGVTIMLITPPEDEPTAWMMKILGVLGFTVLSSFGVSVGYKYLSK